MTTRRKSRVKSAARSERMRAMWADPAYRDAMREKAKAQRAREIANKTTPPTPAGPPQPPGADDPPASPPPSKTTPTSGRRGWTPGRSWR